MRQNKTKLHTVKWTSSVRMFTRIWKIIMPSATLDLRTSGISGAQTLPFPGGRKTAASILEQRPTPSWPVCGLFWGHFTSPTVVSPGLGKTNSRQDHQSDWPWQPTWFRVWRSHHGGLTEHCPVAGGDFTIVATHGKWQQPALAPPGNCPFTRRYSWASAAAATKLIH